MPCRSAVEVAQLRDDLADLVDYDDLVFLVGADPNIVLVVDHDSIRRIYADNEDRGCSGTTVRVHGYLDNLMKRRIRHEQGRALFIEL